ncbi:MAG TPA: methyltransferase domain-containing protein [Thermoanaerobaculia bacterium]|nr:methyltransferase domain-containing protein [Thermoanaerobaculia bacterium]
MFTPERIITPELLDEHDAPRADVERSLRDLRLINRYFGGVRVYRSLLRRLGVVRSVVDLGAGTADLLDSVAGLTLGVAVDIKIEHLAYLRRGSHALRVVADAARLPFRDGAVDAVTSSHFFHHFSPDENEAILRESLRVARRGVAVNDTRRHYAPLLFVRLIAALGLVGRITAFDAPASVLRGYTLGEARAIGGRSGAARMKAVRSWPYRFGLMLWKST